MLTSEKRPVSKRALTDSLISPLPKLLPGLILMNYLIVVSSMRVFPRTSMLLTTAAWAALAPASMAPVNADADTVPSNIANDAERTMDLTVLFPLTEASPIHMFSGPSFPGASTRNTPSGIFPAYGWAGTYQDKCLFASRRKHRLRTESGPVNEIFYRDSHPAQPLVNKQFYYCVNVLQISQCQSQRWLSFD